MTQLIDDGGNTPAEPVIQPEAYISLDHFDTVVADLQQKLDKAGDLNWVFALVGFALGALIL